MVGAAANGTPEGKDSVRNRRKVWRAPIIEDVSIDVATRGGERSADVDQYSDKRGS